MDRRESSETLLENGSTFERTELDSENSPENEPLGSSNCASPEIFDHSKEELTLNSDLPPGDALQEENAYKSDERLTATNNSVERESALLELRDSGKVNENDRIVMSTNIEETQMSVDDSSADELMDVDSLFQEDGMDVDMEEAMDVDIETQPNLEGNTVPRPVEPSHFFSQQAAPSGLYIEEELRLKNKISDSVDRVSAKNDTDQAEVAEILENILAQVEKDSSQNVDYAKTGDSGLSESLGITTHAEDKVKAVLTPSEEANKIVLEKSPVDSKIDPTSAEGNIANSFAENLQSNSVEDSTFSGTDKEIKDIGSNIVEKSLVEVSQSESQMSKETVEEFQDNSENRDATPSGSQTGHEAKPSEDNSGLPHKKDTGIVDQKETENCKLGEQDQSNSFEHSVTNEGNENVQVCHVTESDSQDNLEKCKNIEPVKLTEERTCGNMTNLEGSQGLNIEDQSIRESYVPVTAPKHFERTNSGNMEREGENTNCSDDQIVKEELVSVQKDKNADQRRSTERRNSEDSSKVFSTDLFKQSELLATQAEQIFQQPEILSADPDNREESEIAEASERLDPSEIISAQESTCLDPSDVENVSSNEADNALFPTEAITSQSEILSTQTDSNTSQSCEKRVLRGSKQNVQEAEINEDLLLSLETDKEYGKSDFDEEELLRDDSENVLDENSKSDSFCNVQPASETAEENSHDGTIKLKDDLKQSSEITLVNAEAETSSRSQDCSKGEDDLLVSSEEIQHNSNSECHENESNLKDLSTDQSVSETPKETTRGNADEVSVKNRSGFQSGLENTKDSHLDAIEKSSKIIEPMEVDDLDSATASEEPMDVDLESVGIVDEEMAGASPENMPEDSNTLNSLSKPRDNEEDQSSLCELPHSTSAIDEQLKSTDKVSKESSEEASNAQLNKIQNYNNDKTSISEDENVLVPEKQPSPAKAERPVEIDVRKASSSSSGIPDSVENDPDSTCIEENQPKSSATTLVEDSSDDSSDKPKPSSFVVDKVSGPESEVAPKAESSEVKLKIKDVCVGDIVNEDGKSVPGLELDEVIPKLVQSKINKNLSVAEIEAQESELLDEEPKNQSLTVETSNNENVTDLSPDEEDELLKDTDEYEEFKTNGEAAPAEENGVDKPQGESTKELVKDILNNLVDDVCKVQSPTEVAKCILDSPAQEAFNQQQEENAFPCFANIIEATTIAPKDFENMGSSENYDERFDDSMPLQKLGNARDVLKLTQLARNALTKDGKTRESVSQKPGRAGKSSIKLRSIKQEKIDFHVDVKEESTEDQYGPYSERETIGLDRNLSDVQRTGNSKVIGRRTRNRSPNLAKWAEEIRNERKKKREAAEPSVKNKKPVQPKRVSEPKKIVKPTPPRKKLPSKPEKELSLKKMLRSRNVAVPVVNLPTVTVKKISVPTKRIANQKAVKSTLTNLNRKSGSISEPTTSKKETPLSKLVITRSSVSKGAETKFETRLQKKKSQSRASLPEIPTTSTGPDLRTRKRSSIPSSAASEKPIKKLKAEEEKVSSSEANVFHGFSPRKPAECRNVALKSTTTKFIPKKLEENQNIWLVRKQRPNVARKRGKPYFKNTAEPVREPEPAPIYGVFVDTNFGSQNIDMFINENDDEYLDNQETYGSKSLRSRKRPYEWEGGQCSDNDDNDESDILDYSTSSSNKSKCTITENTMLNCQVNIRRMPAIDRLLPVKKSTKLEPNICELCEPKRIFLSKNSLADHINEEHISKTDTLLVPPGKSNVDVGISTEDMRNICQGCKTMFHSRNRLVAHMKLCKDIVEKSQHQQRKSENLVGSIPGVDLTVLGKNVTISKASSSDLKQEVKQESESSSVTKHICHVCNRRFLMATGLLSHLKTHKSNPPKGTSAKLGKSNLICNICDKTFQLCSDLVDHMSFHSLSSEKEKDILSLNLNKISRIQVSLQRREVIEMCSSSEIDAFSEDSSDFSDDYKKDSKKMAHIEFMPNKCNECGRLFTIKSVFDRHVSLIAKISNLEDQTKCPICDLEMKFRCKLGAHLETHKPRPEEQLTCNKCNKTFRCENNLIRHQLEHEGKLRVNCQYCSAAFSTMSDLYSHQEDCKLKCSEYKCNVCRRVFTAKWRLDLHMRTDEKHGTDPQQPNTYFCDQCGREFKHLSVLKRHVDSRCGTEPLYECSECDKKYFSQGSLASHKRTQHSTEKNFMCQYCSKDFFTKHQLHRHELRHNPDVRPYRCRYPNCDKTYRQPDSLRAHECEHTGLYPYACEFCGVQFSNVKSLKLHRKSLNHWSEIEPNKVVTQACRLKHSPNKKPTKAKPVSEEDEIDPESHEDEPKNLVISEAQYEGVYPPERIVAPQVPQYSTLQPFTVSHLMQHNQQAPVLVQSGHPLASYTQAIENYFVIASHQEPITGGHHHPMMN